GQARSEHREHVAVEVGHVDSGAARAEGLGAHLAQGRLGVRAAHALRRADEAASRLDEARRAVHRGEGPPPVALPFAGEREMDAEVDFGGAARPRRRLREPRARDHRGARGYAPFGRELEEGGNGRVAHSDVIHMDDGDAVARVEAEFAKRGVQAGTSFSMAYTVAVNLPTRTGNLASRPTKSA